MQGEALWNYVFALYVPFPLLTSTSLIWYIRFRSMQSAKWQYQVVFILNLRGMGGSVVFV